ncbi:BON domain-containing protein [Defluviimonas sp. WL0002]|uniref:BON domain-containing protein n=1 Tax=Albidovulum marisflavi TaxID=2984159 RepID=A0ABT2ZC07_9RHOB|nr:BON domain-containing protein [Defluviimonas sp. WL0002]MCV2868662.1 BON domain-containing protein [Defluviimonas sp. WL0002]
MNGRHRRDERENQENFYRERDPGQRRDRARGYYGQDRDDRRGGDYAEDYSDPDRDPYGRRGWRGRWEGDDAYGRRGADPELWDERFRAGGYRGIPGGYLAGGWYGTRPAADWAFPGADLGYRERYRHRGPRDEERGFFERAADEVSSWFGDEEAERRREMDHRGRGPKNYTRSDERIFEDVNDRLTDDESLDATDISVEVKDREVTLDGTVQSRYAKRRAEDCADMVSGVQHVQNNLRVKQPDLPAQS